MKFSTALSIFTLAASAVAQYQGFNYGIQKSDGTGNKIQSDFEAEFNNAKQLVGTNGKFTSARLYTMIQNGGTTDIISAIPAALNTNTSLLLGLWASAGDAAFALEVATLQAALSQYGQQLQSRGLLVGISVGSEDIYRQLPQYAMPGNPGASPSTLVGYISQVRSVVSNSSVPGIPVGHVDTWNAWTDGGSYGVISAVDFLGFNGFPYFQATDNNAPENLANLFQQSVDATNAVAQGKPVWITETGFPVTGPTYNLAVPGLAVAQSYYQQVGCAKLFGKINTWWYIEQDAGPQTSPNPVFGVVGWPLSTTPLYNLSCSSSSSSVSSIPSTLLTSTSPTGFAAATSAPPAPDAPALSSSGVSVVSSLSTPTSSFSPSTSACPANLKGTFEFPHLMVPIDSTQPASAAGTQYSSTINPTTSTLYNFDFPPSYAGQTCSVIFLFPQQSQLVWSSYTFNNQGGLAISQLSSPANQATSYSNTPSSSAVGSVSSLQSGSNQVVSSGPCPAGQTVGYRVDSTDGLALNYFQDYNAAAPIGLYVRVC